MAYRPEETTGRQSRKEKRKPSIDLTTMVYGKVPPQAKELEEAVLGGMLIERAAFDTVAEILSPECFYVDAHQRIFRACQRLNQLSQPIDILTLVEQLKTSEELDTVGGPYAITKLTNSIVSTANIETHCRIVLQKFLQRELIRISGETIGDAYEDSIDVFDLIDKHEKALNEVTTGNLKNNFQSTFSLGAKEIERVDYLRANPQELTGVLSGFPYIDRLTSGWQNGDLIILAARPSVGKTCLALNFARNAAMTGTPIGFFSLEMSGEQLNRRLACAQSMVYLDKLNTPGKMNDVDYKEFMLGQARVNEMPIYVDDTASLNIYELRSKARRMVEKHGVKMLIVDYLQLMSGDEKSFNREQEISTISRRLKVLAKELRVPLIALSQLSRANETQKREPQLSDLRESGAIEQDADVVIFAMRDDYQGGANAEGEISNSGKLKFAKHRNGALDILSFKTDLRIQTWFDYDQWNVYEKFRKENNPF